MELTKLRVDEFLNEVQDSNVSPAGGSVCALCGTLGVSLSQMVCNVTIGKKGYEENDEYISDMLKKIIDLQNKLVILIDEDKNAFNLVYKAIKMPKITKEEIYLRNSTMEEAMKNATLVPFEILKFCYETLNIIENFADITNKNSLSDLGVSAITLKSAVEGSYLTVNYNLSKIKDKSFVDKYKDESEKLYKKSLNISNSIYLEILSKVL